MPTRGKGAVRGGGRKAWGRSCRLSDASAGASRQSLSLSDTQPWKDAGQTRVSPDEISLIRRDVISRGVFTGTKDLDKKLMRYVRQYNKHAAPLKWKYSDPTRRIRCNSSGSMH
jgi:hypothetical protein